jgi:hypothetical protein
VKPKIKKLWLAALRSGKYKQGRRALRDKNKFCCLGVLCDVHSKAKGMEWDGEEYLGSASTLPAQVFKWAGLAGPNPMVDHFKDSLAGKNDGGMSFKGIADLIEAQL